MAAAVAVVVAAVGRGDALPGLFAGTAVGVVDVLLLTRSLHRFGGGRGLNARALGTGMLTRFLSVGILLGLVLCIHGLNPLAALVGFLLMPLAVGLSGVRALQHERRHLRGAADARG